ncbi:hypothetical protein FB45DRAFT_826036 [Roridomyces roridus]|uniref:FAD-binding domain-containing protein n=1 Tax=Roridomyces roridus TaxID=1738132 RepID=A0AAD7FVS3_9AGAR|nr:hypothetical protein FB45DRAFT_826036 [Roridomyces roridus]
MPQTKVIIVGCGVAGPVLALLLKQKGYDPVVYERGAKEREGGLSLLLQLNGLRVLSLIPGFIEQLPSIGMNVDKMEMYSILPSDERLLGVSDYPATLRKEYEYGVVGVRRPAFLELLADLAGKAGIEVHYGCAVVGVEQESEQVRVRLANGEEDTASFVVGCDGLHSDVRGALFGKESAVFTGLTQSGGITPTAFTDCKPTIFNFFGDGMHLITYPISEQAYSWAITQREPETRETWRAMDEAAQDAMRSGPFSKLPFGAGELVKGAVKITKYGLYDRPELKSWHKGRVVLIGDAAHPTSPHLGQGANQAFEDAYHLVRLLDAHNRPTSKEGLEAVFIEFEELRIGRTAELVRGARKAGEARVVEGEERAKARNEVMVGEWRDEKVVLRRVKDLLGADKKWVGFDQ